jgi:hypothetical protein
MSHLTVFILITVPLLLIAKYLRRISLYLEDKWGDE